MKKILRHGRNSKPSSEGGGGGGDDVFTKIKDAFIKAGLADIQCYGNKNNAENYPNEPLVIDTVCEFSDFYWWNHPSGREYQSLLVKYCFRSGYISDSDFRNHLEIYVSVMYGNKVNGNIHVETEGDSQYIYVTIPIQVTNETGTDVFISLYYDNIEIIYFYCTLGTYISD